MSDHILVRGSDGKLIYLQRKTLDRESRQSASGGTASAPERDVSRNRTVADVVDIRAGLRIADEVREEADPEKLGEKIETGRRRIDENLAKFFSLFGFHSASSASRFGRFLNAMSFGDTGSSRFGGANYVDRFIGALFGRGHRWRS